MFTSVSQRKDIVNGTFPNCRFYDALANNLCFNVGHKNVCKSNGPFCTHSSSMDLEVVPSSKLENISLRIIIYLSEKENEKFTVVCSRSPQKLEFDYFKLLLFYRGRQRNVPKF